MCHIITASAEKKIEENKRKSISKLFGCFLISTPSQVSGSTGTQLDTES